MAAQLNGINGFAARFELLCISFAITSLPVPVSPVKRTGTLLLAILRVVLMISVIDSAENTASLDASISPIGQIALRSVDEHLRRCNSATDFMSFRTAVD